MAWEFDKVFIVRHGETEWNVQGRRQGQLDSPLTAAGRSSAQQISDSLSELDPDALFSSPLGRAWSTALIIDAALGLGIRSEGGLSEIHHGELGGLTNDEIEESHPGLLAERQACLHSWRFPGGESYADADLRAAEALSRIEATLTRRPVLVTHEMIARMLVRNLLGLSADEALSRSFTQGTVYQVTPMRGILTMP
jgi:probable phosphoglycerate mutase